MRGWILVSFLFSVIVVAQDRAQPGRDLEKAIDDANALFRLNWPMVTERLKTEMDRSFSEMNDGDTVRKMTVTTLKMDAPPQFELQPAPDGQPFGKLKIKIPGKGKWSIKVAGEMVPPWQRNKQKWRKLRLTLKDVSLTQEYNVDWTDPNRVLFEPAAPPKLTYRLTSPNLIYKAVLSAAQRFLKSSIEDMLEDSFMDGLPSGELAMNDIKSFGLNRLMGGVGDSLDVSEEHIPDFSEKEYVGPAPVELVSLGPAPSRVANVGQLDDDAFSLEFVDKNIDPYAESFIAEARVKTPPGSKIQDVTFKMGDKVIASFDKPPYKMEVKPDDESQVLLATVTLDDGFQEDDFLFIEGRGHIEEMTVQWVNLYLSFPTRPFSKNKLFKLTADDFEVRENGVVQNLSSLEPARNRPLALAVVMDNSGSMKGKRIQHAREAAVGFVSNIIREGDSMVLVSYNSRLKASQTITEKPSMLRAIRNQKKMTGDTRTNDAIGKALDILEEKDATRVILLVTDGFNYGSKISHKGILKKLKSSDVLLYTVGIDVNRRKLRPTPQIASLSPANLFVSQRPSLLHLQDLYDMSRVTGGRTIFIDRASMLNRAFKVIEEELRAQLRLGYSSNLPPGKKGWRQIEVIYKHQKIPILHKDGYMKN